MSLRQGALRTALRRAVGGARLTIAAALLSVPVLTAPAGGATAATCALPAAAQPDLDPQKQEWLTYGCSGAYARDLAREDSFAREFVEQRAHQVTKPALVLDIDETSLSNWPAMLANNFRHVATGRCRIKAGGPCGERAWELGARARPITPTLALYNAAKANGVAIFFITGRAGEPALRAATARNLRRAGYRGWTALILRAPNERGLSATEYKSRRRAAIAMQGYTIIASVGDQWSDLDGGNAERAFKLPNPFYFIP